VAKQEKWEQDMETVDKIVMDIMDERGGKINYFDALVMDAVVEETVRQGGKEALDRVARMAGWTPREVLVEMLDAMRQRWTRTCPPGWEGRN
jgi:hypothetical protein